MKLCIQQKVFSWRDRFTVWDEFGNDRFYVEGELFSWGKQLHIYDVGGHETAFIKQEVFSFLPRFTIYVNGNEIAEIIKRFTLLYQRYAVENLGWDVDGDFFAHDYAINSGDRQIASIHKEWFTWGDCYSLDIADPRDEIAALSVVLAIDCVMAEADNAN